MSIASAPLSRTTFRTITTLPPPLGAIAAPATAGRNPDQFIFVHYEFSKIITKSRRANFAVSSFSETEHCAGGMQVPRFWFFAAFASIHVWISRCCDQICRAAVGRSGILDAASSRDFLLVNFS
jgi:hypothetical protein